MARNGDANGKMNALTKLEDEAAKSRPQKRRARGEHKCRQADRSGANTPLCIFKDAEKP